MPSSASTDDCPECQEQKTEAAAKAKATPPANDGLRLGVCAPLYERWAECVEREQGQAKACANVLKEFRECHRALLGPQR